MFARCLRRTLLNIRLQPLTPTVLPPAAARAFSATTRQNADFTHAVIGGGAIGLAIARQLQQREGASTILIERHGSVGTETSSRNSEVIHAGLYYGPASLKTRLCVRGKHLLYDFCGSRAVPHRKCGKWIVAQDEPQMSELQKVYDFARSIDIPIDFISPEEARRREPDVRAEAGVLESPTTGIVDSHALMQALQGGFEERGGECAFHSSVARVEPIRNGAGGWKIHVQAPEQEGEAENSSSSEKEGDSAITADTLINSAGLYAIPLSNSILPPERHITPFYAKGSYFSYAASRPKPSTLIYPAPRPGHGGLGTHLTLDMAGRVRFGPDVEWVDSPTDLSVNAARLAEALDEIETYLPGIDRSAVGLDYAGIRPKMAKLAAVASGGKGFQDFYIKREDGFEGFVNLLGMESPGLTSCLAIGEEVEKLLYG